MPRNLVICCDGTNNEFGPENTNVVRLVQVLQRDTDEQHLYYDPGVGTLPEPGVWTRLGKAVSKWLGLAFGTGLTAKVEMAYAYLMENWRPGDRVFLFGFSRGAYAVRVLAGMLHALGLLPHGGNNLVPYVMRLFKSIRNRKPTTNRSDTSWYWKLCDEFRWTFARPVPGAGDDRRFPVHFLGVWDTVSSVRWVWEPARFPFTALNPSIGVVRHAVSIDERRWFFRQNLMQPAHRQDFEELWFPGVHGDIGGGYPENESGLWRIPFEWILGEGKKNGLFVSPQRLEAVLHRSTPSTTPWNDPKHESLRGLWWLAEYFPKMQSAAGSSRCPRIGLGRHRFIRSGALLHRSTLLRIRDINYAPSAFSQALLRKVRALAEIPERLALE